MSEFQLYVILQDIGVLATFSKEIGEISDGAIYVKGNVILWSGPTASIPAEYTTADEVISLPDRVVIPGLVNTHHHMFQCLTRCIAQVWSICLACRPFTSCTSGGTAVTDAGAVLHRTPSSLAG